MRAARLVCRQSLCLGKFGEVSEGLQGDLIKLSERVIDYYTESALE